VYGEHSIDEFLETLKFEENTTGNVMKMVIKEMIQRWEKFKQGHRDGGIDD